MDLDSVPLESNVMSPSLKHLGLVATIQLQQIQMSEQVVG